MRAFCASLEAASRDHTGWLTWLDSNSYIPFLEMAFEIRAEFGVICRKKRPETVTA